MAFYPVEFSCGHTHDISFSGTDDERNSAIKYYKQFKKCFKCDKEERNKNYNERVEKAVQENCLLISLEGSEKQIAWAEVVRADKIREIDELYSGKILSDKGQKLLDDTIKLLEREDDAVFWIDIRDDLPKIILRMVAEDNNLFD